MQPWSPSPRQEIPVCLLVSLSLADVTYRAPKTEPPPCEEKCFPVSTHQQILCVQVSTFVWALKKYVLMLCKKIFKFMFRERGREGERVGEKHQWVVASCSPPTGDLACNPGMCPEWGSNWRPFDLQAGAQPTEPHQPGLTYYC